MSVQEQPQAFTNAAFNRHLQQHKLMGARCSTCGALYLPPRPICPACYGDDMSWAELSGRGTLLAFTTVHIAPTAMIEAGYGRENPYCTGIVALEEGPAISAQILDVDATAPQKIEIGTPLQVCFVERGETPEGARQVLLAFQPASVGAG